jgi:DNA (cytosine-5)-methyltransferase 1
MLLPGEITVDNFAGGGGASTGIGTGIDGHVDIAINHDVDAINMHRLNHPKTKHYCESVWDVDPVEACAGRPVGLAWFSPDCKHFSKAKGGKPVDKNIRGLAWVAVRWAASVPLRMMMLENVEEFLTWGPVVKDEKGNFKPCDKRKGETYNGFVKALTTGLEKNNPAYKDVYHALFKFNYDLRYKLALYKKIKHGLGYDLEHKILKACDYGVPTTRKRLFLVARNDNQPITWPLPTHGKKGSGLKPYRTIAECIDWSKPIRSIFDRPKKPLVENTLRRIFKGIEKYVVNCDDPFFVPEHAAVPFITEFANSSSQRNFDANEPMRTLCAQVKGGHFGLVTASVIKFRGTNVGHSMNEPLHTISAGGNHLGEVRAFLIKYYGTGGAVSVDEPIDTITTKDRFAIVTVKGERYQIVDIFLRIFDPDELFAAMGFPSDYQISHDSNGKKLSKAKQVARCGNAVCPPVAQALVIANIGTNEQRIAA